MDFSSHFKPLAQAYLIEGDRSAIKSELVAILEKDHDIVFQANPDVWMMEAFGMFAIDHAREIKDLASKRKLGAGKRVFIISADSMTREASNALLKTLEEPGEGTHFFIIMPSAKRVLPTILSRVRKVTHISEATSAIMTPKEFAMLSPASRITKIKNIFAELEKEAISRADITAFIESLLCFEYEKGKGKKETKSLEKQAEAVSYGRDQSASLKMILEYLALTI